MTEKDIFVCTLVPVHEIFQKHTPHPCAINDGKHGTDRSKIRGSLHGRQTFSSLCRLFFEIISRKLTHHTLHAWTINDVSLVEIGPL